MSDLVKRGEELAAEAGQMAGELIHAGRPDLAEWPLAVARGARERNDRVLALERRLTVRRQQWWRRLLKWKPTL